MGYSKQPEVAPSTQNLCQVQHSPEKEVCVLTLSGWACV